MIALLVIANFTVAEEENSTTTFITLKKLSSKLYRSSTILYYTASIMRDWPIKNVYFVN